MLLVRDLLNQITLANESLLLSDVDWFVVQELTQCLKLVCDTIIPIQLKKSTARVWLMCKLQLQHKSVNNASTLVFSMLYATERIKATLLSNGAFLAAIYVDPRY